MFANLNRILKRRKMTGGASAAPSGNEQPSKMSPPKAAPKGPEWKDVLTEALRSNCLAPSEEAVLHAYDLYCRDLYAPFHSRRQEMADRFSELNAEFSDLQAIIPKVIERAMARDPWEFSHIIDHEPEK